MQRFHHKVKFTYTSELRDIVRECEVDDFIALYVAPVFGCKIYFLNTPSHFSLLNQLINLNRCLVYTQGPIRKTITTTTPNVISLMNSDEVSELS